MSWDKCPDRPASAARPVRAGVRWDPACVGRDERGCGMSEWNPRDLTLERWVADLETIVDAARPDEPVTLLGISQGAATCISYAIRHPDRVARMILYGGYARGKFHRGAVSEREYRATAELTRIGWGRDNAA